MHFDYDLLSSPRNKLFLLLEYPDGKNVAQSMATEHRKVSAFDTRDLRVFCLRVSVVIRASGEATMSCERKAKKSLADRY